MSTEERYTIIEKCFQEYLAFLITVLYYEIDIEKDDYSQPAALQFIKINLQNKSFDRNICFIYQPFNGGGYTVLSVKSKQFFKSIYIDSFLKFNSNLFPKIWRITSMDESPGNSFEEKINNYFLFIKNLFQNELKQVVEGKKWIDLPTDWESMGK